MLRLKKYIGLLNQLITQCDQKISEFDDMLELDDLDPKFEVYINEKRNESLLNKEHLRLQIKSIKGTKRWGSIFINNVGWLSAIG